MSPNQTSPLDQHRTKVEKLLATGASYAEVARRLTKEGVETSKSSLRRAVRRWEILPLSPKAEAPGVKVEADSATITGAAGQAVNDPEALIRERGLDPEEWELASIRVNEWDSPTGETLQQLRVDLKRKLPLSLPESARIPLGYKLAKPKAPSKKRPKLVVLVGDQQAPYQDPNLHRLFLNFLGENQPDEGVLIGDLLDFTDISRHPAEPEWSASTQTCIDAAGSLLYDYVLSSPATRWKKLAGNHEERLRRSIINQIPDLYKLRRANGQGEEPVISIPHLLRLDELGVEYIEAPGSYEHGQINLSPYLAARHGWIARKGSGVSARATLEHLGYSVVVGHTHRQSKVYKTKHDIDGTVSTLVGAEIGCMCRIENGLGYTPAPDWQRGFATAEVWPDGRFSLDLATYVAGNLFWRSQRYN